MKELVVDSLVVATVRVPAPAGAETMSRDELLEFASQALIAGRESCFVATEDMHEPDQISLSGDNIPSRELFASPVYTAVMGASKPTVTPGDLATLLGSARDALADLNQSEEDGGKLLASIDEALAQAASPTAPKAPTESEMLSALEGMVALYEAMHAMHPYVDYRPTIAMQIIGRVKDARKARNG